MTNNVMTKTDEATKMMAPVAASPILGVEGMDDKDGSLPRIQILQAKSTLLKNLTKAKVPAREGQFVNTADEKKPLDFVHFIPCYMTKKWDVYEIKGETKKWLFTTFDKNDPRLEGKRFRKEEQKLPNGSSVWLKAEVYEVITLVALVDNYPTVINFKSTSAGAGKDLYTKARKSGKALWAYKYTLLSSEVQADNPYFVMYVEQFAETTKAEQELAYQLYQSFAGKATKLNVNAEVQAGGEEEVPF